MYNLLLLPILFLPDILLPDILLHFGIVSHFSAAHSQSRSRLSAFLSHRRMRDGELPA